MKLFMTEKQMKVAIAGFILITMVIPLMGYIANYVPGMLWQPVEALLSDKATMDTLIDYGVFSSIALFMVSAILGTRVLFLVMPVVASTMIAIMLVKLLTMFSDNAVFALPVLILLYAVFFKMSASCVQIAYNKPRTA